MPLINCLNDLFENQRFISNKLRNRFQFFAGSVRSLSLDQLREKISGVLPVASGFCGKRKLSEPGLMEERIAGYISGLLPVLREAEFISGLRFTSGKLLLISGSRRI